MERIIAVNSNSYHGFSIEDAIDSIAKIGFKYIELTCTKGWTEHVMPSHSLSYLNFIKEKCEGYNIIPLSLSGHTNLMDDSRIPDFIENMKLAHFFGCKYIVSSIGEAHLKYNVLISAKETATKLIALIPYLEKYSLQLVLEVHGKEHGTGAKIKEITDYVNCDLININYDTANAIFYGDVDIYNDIEKCIDDITYIHIKDKAGANNEWNFPAIGKGNIDFNRITKLLDNNNNNCPYSIEIEFTAKGPSDLNEVNQAVKDSYDYLIGMGMKI